jgi:hypothetical protein
MTARGLRLLVKQRAIGAQKVNDHDRQDREEVRLSDLHLWLRR